MHRSSSFALKLSLLAVSLLLVCSESLYSDRIVLKDGNVVEGEVIRTTERDITLKGRFGMISFPLKQVRRVHERGGKVWSPGSRSPADPRVSDSGKSGGLKQRLLRSMREIEANPLDYWESFDKEPAPLKVDNPYRLRTTRGDYQYSDRLPADPAGYERVWVHRRTAGAARRAAGEEVSPHWAPLYWHDGSKRWLPTHRYESSFLWEEKQVEKMLSLVADAAGSGSHARFEVLMRRLRTSSHVDEKLQLYLKELTEEIASDWGGHVLLYKICLRNVSIARADPREKVNLARERRLELRELLRRMP